MEQRAHVAFITTNQIKTLWCKFQYKCRNKESCQYKHMEDTTNQVQTLWCKSQDECKDREACQYKHMETYRVRY